MDGQHFDEFTRRISIAASRRRVLQGLVGGLLGLTGIGVARAIPVGAQASCLLDDDCVGDEICIGGLCDLCRATAEACLRDSDCCGEQACLFDVCATCLPQNFNCARTDGVTCCAGFYCADGGAEGSFCQCTLQGSGCTDSSQCCAGLGLVCNGSICDFADDCAAEGEECDADADCCDVLICASNGLCQPCLGAGDGECAVDADCCDGLVCDGIVCVAACAAENDACETDEDCCAGLVCPTADSCVPCAALGENCLGDEDCCGDLLCDGTTDTCVGAGVADHATITIHKATCPTGVGGNIFEECHGNALGGVSFDINGFEVGSGTITTGDDGVASATVLEASATGDITLSEDPDVFADYLGAYVYCAEQNSGTVLYDASADTGSVTFTAHQGDDIVCDWYNITAAEETSACRRRCRRQALVRPSATRPPGSEPPRPPPGQPSWSANGYARTRRRRPSRVRPPRTEPGPDHGRTGRSSFLARWWFSGP